MLPTPAFLALTIFAFVLVGTTTDAPLEIFTGACVLTTAGIVTWAVRSWNRSCWFTCGLLASLVIATLLIGSVVIGALGCVRG